MRNLSWLCLTIGIWAAPLRLAISQESPALPILREPRVILETRDAARPKAPDRVVAYLRFSFCSCSARSWELEQHRVKQAPRGLTRLTVKDKNEGDCRGPRSEKIYTIPIVQYPRLDESYIMANPSILPRTLSDPQRSDI